MRTRNEIEDSLNEYHRWTDKDIIENQIKLQTEVLLDIRDLLANEQE